MNGIIDYTQKAKAGTRILGEDFLSRIGQRKTVKPRVLNLLVNDICNAECQMCNIWKQEPEQVVSPDELHDILADDLFTELNYVGVSGGEPTLRPDLPELYEAIATARPDVSTGIITNGLVPDVVIDRIENSGYACADHGVDFNVMVSLDGVGEVHDQVRGTDGAFESTVAVLRHFRDKTPFSVSVGCTVTKDNVWNVHELLEFCEEENVDYKFRVAEFIDRLYNDDRGDKVRNFTQRELYHLGLFFAKLEDETPLHATKRRTYRNIRKMLMEGADRSIACYQQTHGATLDSAGNLMYCAPKSPKLGNTLETSAKELYYDNTDVRDQIEEQHCADCIHDYPSPQITTELEYVPREFAAKKRLALPVVLKEYNVNQRLGRIPEGRTTLDKSPEEVLVFGWYGTETAGDKAILAEILHRILEKNPESNITVASMYPYHTEWTLEELGYGGVEVIPTYSREFVNMCQSVDEVVMGGGPLMHIGALGFVLKAFLSARKAGVQTRIAGCGIGPLDGQKKYTDAVRAILKLADQIDLRNDGSVREAEQLCNRNDITNSGDPAFGFVHRWMESTEEVESSNYLNLYLREWPEKYAGNRTEEEYRETRESFEKELGEWITELSSSTGLVPRLLPMHHFHVGNDDREFARRFAKEQLSGIECEVEHRPLTLREILSTMQEGELSVCMRYHSVGFANELGEDFYAIDYSLGGKVRRYLEEEGDVDMSRTVPEIAAGEWRALPKHAHQ